MPGDVVRRRSSHDADVAVRVPLEPGAVFPAGPAEHGGRDKRRQRAVELGDERVVADTGTADAVVLGLETPRRGRECRGRSCLGVVPGDVDVPSSVDRYGVAEVPAGASQIGRAHEAAQRAVQSRDERVVDASRERGIVGRRCEGVVTRLGPARDIDARRCGDHVLAVVRAVSAEVGRGQKRRKRRVELRHVGVYAAPVAAGRPRFVERTRRGKPGGSGRARDVHRRSVRYDGPGVVEGGAAEVRGRCQGGEVGGQLGDEDVAGDRVGSCRPAGVRPVEGAQRSWEVSGQRSTGDVDIPGGIDRDAAGLLFVRTSEVDGGKETGERAVEPRYEDVRRPAVVRFPYRCREVVRSRVSRDVDATVRTERDGVRAVPTLGVGATEVGGREQRIDDEFLAGVVAAHGEPVGVSGHGVGGVHLDPLPRDVLVCDGSAEPNVAEGGRYHKASGVVRGEARRAVDRDPDVAWVGSGRHCEDLLDAVGARVQRRADAAADVTQFDDLVRGDPVRRAPGIVALHSADGCAGGRRPDRQKRTPSGQGLLDGDGGPGGRPVPRGNGVDDLAAGGDEDRAVRRPGVERHALVGLANVGYKGNGRAPGGDALGTTVGAQDAALRGRARSRRSAGCAGE